MMTTLREGEKWTSQTRWREARKTRRQGRDIFSKTSNDATTTRKATGRGLLEGAVSLWSLEQGGPRARDTPGGVCPTREGARPAQGPQGDRRARLVNFSHRRTGCGARREQTQGIDADASDASKPYQGPSRESLSLLWASRVQTDNYSRDPKPARVRCTLCTSLQKCQGRERCHQDEKEERGGWGWIASPQSLTAIEVFS